MTAKSSMATLLSVAVLMLTATLGAAEPAAQTHELESEAEQWGGQGAAQIVDEKTQATERVNDLVDNIRRLQYSYDFDSNCVSSFRECVDDSNCESDEGCIFTASRKKRKLEEAASKDQPSNLRSLLFGSNAVGQCVCL